MFFRSIRRKLDLIEGLLRIMQQEQLKAMSKIDDLNNAVANVRADFTQYSTAVETKLAAIQQAHVDDDTDAVEANVASLKQMHDEFAAKIAALSPAPAAPAAADPAPAIDPASTAPAAA